MQEEEEEKVEEGEKVKEEERVEEEPRLHIIMQQQQSEAGSNPREDIKQAFVTALLSSEHGDERGAATIFCSCNLYFLRQDGNFLISTDCK